MPICKKCFTHYIHTNPGWCPYCTRHLIFHGVGKGDFNEYEAVFEKFISEETTASISDSNGCVQTLNWSCIVDRWMCFIMNQ